MIPVAICMHYQPDLKRRCYAGMSAPADCHGCRAYLDGLAYIGPTEKDAERVERWREAREPSTPRAHFRGISPSAPWPR